MTDLTRGRCGDRLNVQFGTPDYCKLLAGHAGWHRGDTGAEWTATASGSALTPETLAEWRKDAVTERTVWGKSNDQRRILALIDALAAEKAAREEAEQRAEFWKAGHKREQEAFDAEKARADKAEQERAAAFGAHERTKQSLRREAMRADRIARERDSYEVAANVLGQEKKAAEARVAALEAGINALADEWSGQDAYAEVDQDFTDDPLRCCADALRALTETDPTKEN